MRATAYVQTTHTVENQPPELVDYDAYGLDAPLQEAALRHGTPDITQKLEAYGREVGSAEMLELGAQANRHVPELRTHDRYGHRIDEVVYHPAYHELMRRAQAHEVHSVTWKHPGKGAHFAHAGLMYLHAQAEAGSACPLTMTHACVPSLRVQPELSAVWEPRVLATTYDPRALPAGEKHSATFGMAMTEKQGGSDLRGSSTRARALGQPGPGQAYELTGHKWFCSAPMSDAFLSLAQTELGLSCFLIPRFLPDGTRNRFLLQRLKDKLGNRSNASSEVEYDHTWAQLVGEEGRGVATILQMVAQTRVDCAAGSAGLMRQALLSALHHARHRVAFGKKLVDQPIMQRVLADLALESEAATALSMRVASSYDAAGDEVERWFARLCTPITKYWITRRATGFIFEAMECLGGAGYVEESGLPRLYREAPVNSIWEGSGNVQCLDVLRVLRQQPRALDALYEIAERARGANRSLDAALSRAKSELRAPEEAHARRVVSQLARLLSASLLVQHAPSAVADAYCATRLPDERTDYGELPEGVDAGALLLRALPA